MADKITREQVDSLTAYFQSLAVVTDTAVYPGLIISCWSMGKTTDECRGLIATRHEMKVGLSLKSRGRHSSRSREYKS